MNLCSSKKFGTVPKKYGTVPKKFWNSSKQYFYASPSFPTFKEGLNTLKDIKKIFPNLSVTLENDKAQRYFIHFNKLPKQKKSESYDEYIGRVLGFFCPGDLQTQTDIKYAVHYKVTNDSGVSDNFYAEICEKLNKPSINNRLNNWKQYAQELNLELSVWIREIINRKVWYDAILKKKIDFINAHVNEFTGFIWGKGWINLSNVLEDDFKNIDKYYPFLVAFALSESNNLFNPLYPLTHEDNIIMTDFMETLLKTYAPDNGPKSIKRAKKTTSYDGAKSFLIDLVNELPFRIKQNVPPDVVQEMKDKLSIILYDMDNILKSQEGGRSKYCYRCHRFTKKRKKRKYNY